VPAPTDDVDNIVARCISRGNDAPLTILDTATTGSPARRLQSGSAPPNACLDGRGGRIGGVAAAWLLLKLIALTTNLVWFGHFSTAAVVMAKVHPSLWLVAAPAIGGLLIGLMARFGSEKIRGHGIPEAIEAILIGGSRMSLKVALLKPISSAISIPSSTATLTSAAS
jgi:hypothetical protein